MLTVDASTIIDDAQRFLGRDLDQLETREKQEGRTAFSLALQEVWETWWWEQLMKCEPLAGATVYAAATAFAADDFCYYPATQKFYQAMQATTGNAPATIGSDGSYTTNYNYWAEALAEPSAADYDSTETYAVGDKVRSTDDGQVYQLCRTVEAISVTGAGSSAANGIYELTATNTYTKPDYYVELALGFTSNYWQLLNGAPDAGVTLYSQNQASLPTNVEFPWTEVLAGTSPAPAVEVLSTYSGNPTNAETWHKLIAFTPAITTAGKVRAVGVHDLRNSPNAGQVEFEESLEGIRIPGWSSGVPWVWYRRPTPVITGDDYDSTIIYTATPAAQLTFD